MDLKIRIKQIKLTTVLITVNIAIYILSLFIAFIFGIDTTYALYILGAEHYPSILAGEVWRLVLPAFLHGGILHLLVNVYALYILGNLVENYYGAKKLLTVYILTAFVGSLASIFVIFMGDLLRGYPAPSYAISIGASGAIFGIVGLLLGHNYKKDIYNPKIPIETGVLWTLVIINLIFGFGFNIGGGININNSAHIGGLVAGFVIGLFLNIKNSNYQTQTNKILEKGLFAFSMFLLLGSLFLNFLFLL